MARPDSIAVYGNVGLQQLRHDLVRAEQDRADHQHDDERHAELAMEQQPNLDDRILLAELPRDESRNEMAASTVNVTMVPDLNQSSI